MNTVQNTLVLSPGASISYGYPSGGGLVKKIVWGLEHEKWRRIIGDLGIHDRIRALLRALHRAARPASIGARLGHQPYFGSLGTLSIALSLFETGMEGNLHVRPHAAKPNR